MKDREAATLIARGDDQFCLLDASALLVVVAATQIRHVDVSADIVFATLSPKS